MGGIALLCSKVGHSKNLPKDKQDSLTDADAGRQDYLKRLGIQRKAKGSSFVSVSSNHHKTKDQLEINAKKPSTFVNVLSRQETTSQVDSDASTPSFTSAMSEESEDEMDAEMMCRDLKARDDFRIAFLRKLSYEKVWLPPTQRLPKSQTVTIFDWDDTLLCTSFLVQSEAYDRPLTSEMYEVLRGLEKRSTQILELALKLGQTYIITNAMEGWVEQSAAKYVPGMMSVLQKVPIISARSKYEASYPRNVSMWKINAFQDLQRELDLPIITNLISVGDAKYEMDAAMIMGKDFSECFIKTIKLRDNPSPEELLRQLDLVTQNFEQIVNNARNMKVTLERKPQ